MKRRSTGEGVVRLDLVQSSLSRPQGPRQPVPKSGRHNATQPRSDFHHNLAVYF
jgi:hypothetical protein